MSIKESSTTQTTETLESDESAYSSQDEIDRIHFDLYDEEEEEEEAIQHMLKRKDAEISRMFMQPRRARSNTAPPNISITFEDGHSKNILDVLSEETSTSTPSTSSDGNNNSNNNFRDAKKKFLKKR